MATVNADSMYKMAIDSLEMTLKNEDKSDGEKYSEAFNKLLFLRTDYLRRILIKRLGTTVQSGPFQGMEFHSSASEGCYIPKLLGCYESELHPYIEQIIQRSYKKIINIGCAEGYYTIGMARRMPETQFLSFDTNPLAQEKCKQLAEMNNVQDNISISGTLTSEELEKIAQKDTLILCDIEGAEYQLLKAAALQNSDLIIELHNVFNKERIDVFLNSFSDTHHIQLVDHQGRNPGDFKCLKGFKHLDQWLSIWEFRSISTPWAIMKAKVS